MSDKIYGNQADSGNTRYNVARRRVAALEGQHPAELQRLRAVLDRALWGRDGYRQSLDPGRQAEAEEVLDILLSDLLRSELLTLITSSANDVDPTTDPAVNQGLLASKAWDPVPGYRCRNCLSIARRHPQTAHIWGCPSCGFTTAALSVSFEPGSAGVALDFVYRDGVTMPLAGAS